MQNNQELRSCIRDIAGTGEKSEDVVEWVQARNAYWSYEEINETIEEMVKEGDLLRHKFLLADPSEKAFWESRHNWRVWVRRIIKTVEFILDWV